MGTMTSPETILSNPGCVPVLSFDNPASDQTQNCWQTILLVEDEAFVRDVTQEVLEMSGYTVLTAADGTEAIRLFEQHTSPVDLLVTDVVMPGMNGRELANRLLMRCPGLKMIFISGYADNPVVREGTGLASVGYLQKPFTLDALTRKVREVIDANMRERACSTH